MASVPVSSRAAEWKAHWPLVLAAMAGISFNSITSYSVGLFMEPLQKEFGWSRTVISSGMTLSAFVALFLSAPMGAVIDRWGTRRIAVPGLLAASAGMAMSGLANGSTWQWYGFWLVYAFIALTTKTTVWTYATSSVFDAGRSLAIAVAMSGAAVAQVLAPIVTNELIVQTGWRMAYVWLGVGWGGFAFVLSLIFLRDRHGVGGAKAASGTPDAISKASGVQASVPGGMTLRQAFRDPVMIRIGLATFITLLLGVAVIVHEVPILTDAGVSRSDAAWLASLTGIASIFGKLASGWLMERRSADWTGSCTLAFGGVAFVMLLEQFRSPAMIVGAVLIIGYTSGAKLHICAYMTSRYAGMRHFGAIFGMMSSLIALGSALGPVLAGRIFDTTGDYSLLMLIGIPGSLLSGLLIFRLGAYPEWPDFEAPGAPTPALSIATAP